VKCTVKKNNLVQVSSNQSSGNQSTMAFPEFRTSMNHPSDPERSTVHIPSKHAEHVVNMARRLANGKQPGVFATVDENGMPHIRWMATLSLHDWPTLYTITSPTSAKVRHIQHNPQVSWMFSNEEMNVIVNLRGHARIVDDIGKMQRVWKLLEDKSKAYFLSLKTDGPGFAVIETTVEDVDCTVPRYDFRFQAHNEELSTCKEAQ